MKDILARVLTWWHGQTVGTQLYTWRNGKEVGRDAAGNIFYVSKDDKRWVVYNGEVEASRVSPEWHGWLHHTWDEPPSEKPLPKKSWEKPHIANMTGTPLAYAPRGSIRRPEPAPRQDYEAWTPE